MKALIIGMSGGIGTALAQNLRARGFEVTGMSRSTDGLEVTDEASVADHLGRLSGEFDRVIVATGALTVNGAEPEKGIKALTAAAMIDQFRVNAVGPALVLKHSLRLLPRDRRAVFAALSARVGSIGDNQIGGWHSYRTSKTALNQLMHGASIELRRTHKQATCVCLHPGTVETPFTAKYAGHHKTVPAAEAAENLVSVMERLRPEQSGGFFDYAGAPIAW
ncbi:MAG: SDR family NAD(P)-dependent oxidoreductase [Paracoccaceae bacterium]